MAEMVYRRRRHRVRMMDEKRFVIPFPSYARVISALESLIQMTPGLLLSMADLLGMQSGVYAACAVSMAALRKPVWPTCAGAAAAVLLRFVWGYEPRWESLLTIAMLMTGGGLLHERGNTFLMCATALSLLPMAVRSWLAPTALPALMSAGAIAFATLSAPVICRGLHTVCSLREGAREKKITRMEDRLALSFLLLLIMCGGARLLLAGMNAAMLMASAGVLILGLCLGSGAGCAGGLICGVCMALMDLPMMLAPALGCGGFLAGVMRATGRRWLSCGCFGAVGMIVLLCSNTAGLGCGAALMAVSVAGTCVPAALYDRLNRLMRRLTGVQAQSGDAYAACMLAEWERTVDALAMSVPSPRGMEENRDASWWTSRLCDGCGSLPDCGGLRTKTASDRAEAVWACRNDPGEVWQGALEGLRGLGCQRLYHLQQGMEAMRREELLRQRSVRQAISQRNMLVTHLTAMAGAARRFAHLSLGESWWDAVNASRIRAALADAAAPADLMWLRRVDGHVQAVFTLEDLIGAGRQADELCELVTEATGADMMTVSIDGGRVRLAQRPPLDVRCGAAYACADGQTVCGDTFLKAMLADGRFLAAMSDGMGHGEKAALCSRQTSELLRLCLDAGYTLQQALTAVNGMMLLGDCGERFITVDLLTIDLWSGAAELEKLGSASTWIMHQGMLNRTEANALPLGILEDVEAGERMLHLVPGDAVVLLTDGVEEVLGCEEAMQDAVRLALTEDEPERAAESLLQAAFRTSEGVRKDDQTVMVLRICAVQD